MADATRSPAPFARSYWASPAVIVAGLISLLMAASGLRGMLDPVTGSAYFGLPVADWNAAAFVQVYGARNFVFAGFALVLLVWRQLRPLAIFLAMAALIPWLDMWIVISRAGFGRALALHIMIEGALLVSAYLVWRKAAGAP
jgi:Domain of unknown function (DUF4267)